MRPNERVSGLGIRTVAARVEMLGPQDITLRGTYWYDLQARRPLAAMLKRIVDIAISAPAVVLLAPLFLVRPVERERCVGFRGHEFDRLVFRGKFLKAAPQLVNVLQGSMSLVGPRAIEPWEPRRRAGRRFTMRPGITGPWRFSDADEFELDRQYVNEWSGLQDLAILLRTVAHPRHAAPTRSASVHTQSTADRKTPPR